VATNIEEALQGAGAVSAKPVTMETIPEATIDVGGGSQSLDIEGLGVKRRKNDLSVTTSSTSQIAIQDLFGDLLDEVNFSDPSSVDAFRESAVSRINEFDSDTFTRTLDDAASLTSDLAAFSRQFTQPTQEVVRQDQFQQVFGPSTVTTGDDADLQSSDIGLDTATSTEAQDLSALTDPNLAADLFGGVLGAFGPGAGFSGLATNVGLGAVSRSFGDLDVTGVFGGFNNAADALNRDITNPTEAIGALDAAMQAGRAVNSVANFARQNKSLEQIFTDVTKNVEEYIGGVISAVTNPAQAMSAFGMRAAYGTLTPDLYSFETPQGKMNFAFDKKTGAIAVPGFINTIMGMSPLSRAYSFAQRSLSQLGYTDAMADRNMSAIDAFSMPGIELGPMSVYNSKPEASIGINPQTGAASTVGAFGALDVSQAGFGAVGFDLGAIADAIGSGTINDLSFTDFQDAAITGHLGHGPLGLGEEEDLAQSMAASFAEAGLDTAQGIADAAEQASKATAAFAAELEAFTGLDITALDAVDAAGRAGVLSASQAAAVKDMAQTDPIGVLGARMSAFERGFDFGVMTEPEARKSAAEAIERAVMDAATAAATNSFSFDAGGYNSNTPSNTSIDIAERTMEITNTNMMDPNNKEQQEVAKNVALEIAREREVTSTYGPDAFGQPGFSIDPNFGYEDITDEDISSGGGGGKGGGKSGGEDTSRGGREGEDESGVAGGGDAGGADGEGAGTYICTAAYANGVTDYSTFSANRKYGIRLRRNDPYLMKGYDLVGPTYAKWFGNNGVGKTLTNYYKKSVMGEQLSWKYKLLEKFLLYINRPTLRTLGYIHERISGKG
jgi:hypothetical protein